MFVTFTVFIRADRLLSTVLNSFGLKIKFSKSALCHVVFII